jgi:hypothetical protein
VDTSQLAASAINIQHFRDVDQKFHPHNSRLNRRDAEMERLRFRQPLNGTVLRCDCESRWVLNGPETV